MKTNPERQESEFPDAFRTGFIAGISIILGFALNVLHNWSYSRGAWTAKDLWIVIPVGVGVFTLTYCLYRALNPSDLTLKYFLKSRNTFLFGVVLIFIGFAIGSILPE